MEDVGETLKKPTVVYFPRRSRRAAGMRGKFISRNGRTAWTPKRKVVNDDSK